LRAGKGMNKIPFITVIELRDAMVHGEPFEPSARDPVVGVTPVEA